MNDYWATVIPRYVAWCVVARLAGCRVVWVGAGVGPIRRRPWRYLAGIGFRASRLVTVRDAASEMWVRRCAARAIVRRIPDPAFFQAVVPARSDDARGVGIVARGPVLAGAADSDRLSEAIATTVLGLQARGEHVGLISFQPTEDGPFFEEIGRAIDRDGGVRPSIAWLSPDPAAAMTWLATFERLVSVRLHGLILGAMVGVPAVTVGYDPKVGEAAALLGLDDVHVPLPDVSAATLLSALDRLGADTGRRVAVLARADGLRARRVEVADLIDRAVSA